LLVQDRRPGLDTADYRFDGIEAKIYLACDAGATAADVCRQLSAEGDKTMDAGEIENYLQELVDVRLMYREGKSFLSLAIAVNNAAALRGTPNQEVNNFVRPATVHSHSFGIL
jgi:hypothetical protein